MIVLLATPTHNIPYLFAAFAITWALFFGYLFFTSRRQRDLELDICSIKSRLDEHESGKSDGIVN